MGRPAAITYEQVAIAADAIREDGVDPTQNSVYERLGRRGSMGTIHRHFAQWRAEHNRKAEVTLSLPPALQRTILEFIGQEISEQRRELEDALHKANQEARDLASESELQQFQIEELSESLSNERSAYSSLQGRLDQLQAEHEKNSYETREAIDTARSDSLRERQAAEDLRVKLAQATLRLAGMPQIEENLKRSQQELDNERKARHEAERTAAAAQASLEAKREQIASLESTLKEQKQRNGEVVAKLEGDKQALFADLAETRKEASECLAKLARLEGVLEQMRMPGKASEVVVQ